MKKVTIPLPRLIPGLIIGPGSWLGPYIVMNSLFFTGLDPTLGCAAQGSTCGPFLHLWDDRGCYFQHGGRSAFR